MGLSKEEIEFFKEMATDKSIPADERKLYKDQLKEAGISVGSKKTAKKKSKKKSKVKMSSESVAELKKKIKDTTGKTEKECEDIIAQYKSIREKTNKSNKKRVSTLKKKGEIIKGTDEKTADAVLETTKKEVKDKIEKEIKVVEKEAKKQVDKTNLKPADNKKAVEKKVKAETKKITKKMVVDTSGIISAITSSLASHDKDSAKEFLIKLRSDVDKLIKKYVWGGNMAITQTYNIAQSNMSSSSVNPSQFADGGSVDWGFIEEHYPNYDGSDEIMQNNDLQRYVDGEDIDAEMVKEEWGFSTMKEAKEMLDTSNEQIMITAMENKNSGYKKGGKLKPIGTYSVYALVDGFDEAKQDYEQVYYKTDNYDEIIYYIADLKNEGEYTKDMQLIEVMSNGKMRKFNSSQFADGGRTLVKSNLGTIQVVQSDKYGSDYWLDNDGDLFYRPTTNTLPSEDWSEVNEEAFSESERKEFDKEMKKLFGKKINFAKGGRLKSALMRDRKYVSEQEWEQRYSKGKNRPRYKKKSKFEVGGFIVMNRTDGFTASGEVFETREEAQEFVDNFPKRYEAQGYYRNNNLEKMNPQDVELEIIDVEEYAKGGKIEVGDVMANTKTKTIGIIRDVDLLGGDVRTDADGVVDTDNLEHYSKSKHKQYEIAPSTKKEIGSKFAKGGMTTKMYYIVYNEANGEKSYAEVPATSEKEAIEKLKKEGGVERIVRVRKMDKDEYAKGGKIEVGVNVKYPKATMIGEVIAMKDSSAIPNEKDIVVRYNDGKEVGDLASSFVYVNDNKVFAKGGRLKEGVLEEMKKYYKKNKPKDIDGKPLTFDEFKKDMINAFENELTYAKGGEIMEDLYIRQEEEEKGKTFEKYRVLVYVQKTSGGYPFAEYKTNNFISAVDFAKDKMIKQRTYRDNTERMYASIDQFIPIRERGNPIYAYSQMVSFSEKELFEL